MNVDKSLRRMKMLIVGHKSLASLYEFTKRSVYYFTAQIPRKRQSNVDMCSDIHIGPL